MPTENNTALDNVLAVKNAKISKKLLTDDNFEVVRVEPVTGISSAAYNAIVTIKQPIPNTNPVRYSTDAHKVKRITLKEALVLAEIKQNKNGSFYVESLPTDVDGVIELFAGKISFVADEILFAKNGDKLVSIFAKPDSLGFVGGVTLTSEEDGGEVPVGPEEPIPEPQRVTANVLPNKAALNGTNFVVGTNISAEYASVVNDKIIELALAPINANKSVIGPADGGDYPSGVYPTATSEISVLFAVTTIGDKGSLSDLDNYDIVLSANSIPVLKLVKGVWIGVDKPDFVLTDSVKTNATIQNVTREAFLVESGLIEENPSDDEQYVLQATHRKYQTVIRVYIDVPKAKEVTPPETNPGAEFESKLTFDDVIGDPTDVASTVQHVNYGDSVNFFIRGIGLSEPQILHLALPNDSTTEVGGLPATITVKPDEDYLVKLTNVQSDNLTVLVRKDLTNELVHTSTAAVVHNPPIVPKVVTIAGPAELATDAFFNAKLDVTDYNPRKVVWHSSLTNDELFIVPNTSDRLSVNISYTTKPEAGSTFTLTATVDGVVSNEYTVTVTE